MPKQQTDYYLLSGWKTVEIFSESEMIQALGLDTPKKLHFLIEGGKLSYSAHPKATKTGEYEFSRLVYDLNIQFWECLQKGGHNFEFLKFYDLERGKKKYKCTNCPAERFD